jgi:hypothetical protein
MGNFCAWALYPVCANQHALDTRGGAQYKAKENVYQTFSDPRSNWTLLSFLGNTSTPGFSLPCSAKLFQRLHRNVRVTRRAFRNFFASNRR